MCQSISDGGRRCPVHRRDTIAAIRAIQYVHPELPTAVVENLFTELRREGRHAQVTGLSTTSSYEEVITRIESALPEGSPGRAVLSNRHLDDTPDGSTLYALRRLTGAARSRAAALADMFIEISDETGLTVPEVRQQWAEVRESVDTSRGAPTPPEYTEESQRMAYARDLPSDVASVTAFARIRASAQREATPRVTRESFDGRSGVILEAGYDPEGGRLEIVFAGNPENVYAWHSVPSSTWSEINESTSPMRAFNRLVRGNSEYQYASAEESANDAHRVRCSACGQFAVISAHTCPAQMSAEELAESERAAEEGRNALAELRARLMGTSAESSSDADADAEADADDLQVLPVDDIIVNDSDDASEDGSADGNSTEVATSADLEEAFPALVPQDGLVRMPNGQSIPEIFIQPGSAPPELLRFIECIDENGVLKSGNEFGGPAPGDEVEEAVVESDDSTRITMRAPSAVSLPDLRTAGNTNSSYVVHARNNYQIRRAHADGRIENLPSDWDEIPEGRRILFLTALREGEWQNIYYFLAQMPQHGDTIDVSVEWQSGVGHVPRFTSYPRPLSDPVENGAAEWHNNSDAELEREVLPQNRTSSTAYAPRRTLPFTSSAGEELVQTVSNDEVAWVPVRGLRRGLNEGRVVSGEISWAFLASDRRRTLVEPDGSPLPVGVHRESAPRVSGVLAVRKEEDGSIRVVSGRHELQCNCEVYRRNYSCRHVRYVWKHGGRLATNMAAPPASSRSTTENTSGYPVTVLNRGDFEVDTIPTESEDGETTTIGVFRHRSRSRWTQNNTLLMSTPESLGQYSDLTEDELIHASFIRYAYGDGISLPNLNSVRSAARRREVEISLAQSAYLVDPLAEESVRSTRSGRHGRYSSTRWMSEGEGTWGASTRISGNVRVTRNDEGEFVASPGRHFRCSCGRFASEEDAGRQCIHTRVFLASLSSTLNGSVSEEYEGVTAHNEVVAQNVDRMRRARALLILAADHREEAQENPGLGAFDPNSATAQAAAERFVREEDEQAERLLQERLAEEERRRQDALERQRERARVYAERAVDYRAAVEADREYFLQRRPEFASNRAAYLANLAERWREVEPGYGDDTERVRADFEAAQSRRAARQPFLEPILDGAPGAVTDGICDPNIPGSRRFGVEIEFDGATSPSAKEAIIRDMREAGLTQQTRMRGYHGSQSNNWSDWSLESDCTVSGELVTPLLADTPEDWAKMQTMLDILKRHGAKASVRAGAHVNISTSSFLGSSAKNVELVRVMKEYEDVLYRAAADPGRGTHRGGSYCTPNTETPNITVHKSDPTDISGSPLDRYSHGHGRMVNISKSAQMDEGARTEFRVWDSSLDLATIQQQVAISAALADYAERVVEEREESPGERNSPVGKGHYARSHHDLKHADDSALSQVASLADKLFRKHEDRQRFVALFAVNRWAS